MVFGFPGNIGKLTLQTVCINKRKSGNTKAENVEYRRDILDVIVKCYAGLLNALQWCACICCVRFMYNIYNCGNKNEQNDDGN